MDTIILLKKLNDWAGTSEIDYLSEDTGLSACFKGLVPKLWDLGVVSIAFGKGYCNLDFGYGKGDTLEEGESALALCLAIENLIDGGLCD